MTGSKEQLVPVEQIDGETAAAIRVALYRAVPDMPSYPVGIVEPHLARHRLGALRTHPAVEPDEGLVRDVRNQIHAIMAGLVDTVGLIDKNPPGPFAVSKDINESVQALQQVSLKLALFTPSIRAQALEEAANVADRNVKWHTESFRKELILKNEDKQTHFAARCREAEEIAASIRALKGGQGV